MSAFGCQDFLSLKSRVVLSTPTIATRTTPSRGFPHALMLKAESEVQLGSEMPCHQASSLSTIKGEEKKITGLVFLVSEKQRRVWHFFGLKAGISSLGGRERKGKRKH